MNVALPALLIFAILLPGFLFRQNFKRTEKTLLDFKPFGEATIKSVVDALLLCSLWSGLTYVFTPYYVDFATLLALLTGSAQPEAYKRAIEQTSKHALPIVVFFGSLYVFSGLWGRLLRIIVQKKKLDRRDSSFGGFFRFDTPWFYLLKGYDESRVPDGVYIAAVVDISEGPYLYVGVLRDYFFTESGELDRLVLSLVTRRKLASDNRASEDAEKNQTEDRYYPIAGDYFVLKYSDVTTLNLSYIQLDPQ
jgi:hypothetical protein